MCLKRTICGVVCAAMVAAVHAAGAQTAASAPPEPVYGTSMALALGPRVGYDWDLSAWSVGGQVRVPIVPGFALVPSADWYLRSPAQWQLNLDAAFRLGLYGGLYGGAGLGVAHRELGSVQTRSGLNVFVGFSPPRSSRRALEPFVQVRWLLVGNRSPFAAQAGCDWEL